MRPDPSLGASAVVRVHVGVMRWMRGRGIDPLQVVDPAWRRLPGHCCRVRPARLSGNPYRWSRASWLYGG